MKFLNVLERNIPTNLSGHVAAFLPVFFVLALAPTLFRAHDLRTKFKTHNYYWRLRSTVKDRISKASNSRPC